MLMTNRKQGERILIMDEDTSISIEIVEATGKVRLAINAPSGVNIKFEQMEKPEPISAEVREARIMGYEGTLCPACHQRTVVKSGSCWKCDCCGVSGDYSIALSS